MTRKVHALLAFVCAIGMLAAENRLVIPETDRQPIIDGQIAVGEWERATAVSGFLRLAPAPVLMGEREGTVFFLADRSNLFLRVRTSANNDDPGGGLTAKALNRDGAVYEDDSVEISIAPPGDIQYHIIVNVRGTVFDRTLTKSTGKIDVAWNCPGLKIASEARAGVWECEMMIPRKSIGIEGGTFAVNIGRNWFSVGPSALVATNDYLNRQTMMAAEIIPDAPGIQMLGAGDFRNGLAAVLAYPEKGGKTTHVDFKVARLATPDTPLETLKTDSAALASGGRYNVKCPVTGHQLHEYNLLVREDATGKTLLQRVFRAERGNRKSGNVPSTKEFTLEGFGNGCVFYYPSYNKAIVEIEPLREFAGLVSVEDVSLKEENGIFRGRVPVPSEDGLHSFDVIAGGRRFANAFSLRKKTFPWQGNHLGMARTILPPFSPIRQEGKSLNVLLRKYVFSGNGLLSSIVAEDCEILADAMRLEITVNGKTVVVGGKGEPAVKVAPDGYSAEVQGGDAQMELNSVLEYDGFLWNTLQLRGVEGKTIDRLTLVIPLKDELMKYMHSVTADSIRRNPSCVIPAGNGIVWSGDKLFRPAIQGRLTIHPQFVPYIWLGAETKGLSFFMESSYGTRLSTDRPATRVIRENGVLRLEVDFINRPSLLQDGHRIEFGLEATPVKRADRKLARYFQAGPVTCPKGMKQFMIFNEETPLGYHNRWSRMPYKEDWTLFQRGYELGRNGGRTLEDYQRELAEWDAKYAADCQKMFAGLPDIGDRDYYTWFMDCRKEAIKRSFEPIRSEILMCKYSDPTLCTYFDDVEEYFRTEWISGPCGYHGAVRAFPVQSYMDYIIHAYNEEFRHGAQGVYMDDMFLITCKNPETRAKRDVDGFVHVATGILELREIVKRVSVLQYEYGIAPRILQVHMTNALLVPCFSFATSILGWEDHYGEDVFQKRYAEDYVATESLGTQIGAESVALDGIYRRTFSREEWQNGRFEFITRTQLAVLLPRAIKLWVRYETISHHPTVMRAFGVLGQFGTADGDCRFVPFWNDDKEVFGQPNNILLSSYRKPGLTLIVLGNRTAERTVFTLQTRTPIAHFVNAETGEELTDSKVVLNGYDYMLVLAGERMPAWLPASKRIVVSNDYVNGWSLNDADEFKPFGSVAQNGENGVKLESKGKHTAIFTKEQIPVRPGIMIDASATVSGNGRCMIGLYQYGKQAKWQWRGSVGRWNSVSSVPRSVMVSLAPDKPDVENVCIVLAADDGSSVAISDLKVTLRSPQ